MDKVPEREMGARGFSLDACVLRITLGTEESSAIDEEDHPTHNALPVRCFCGFDRRRPGQSCAAVQHARPFILMQKRVRGQRFAFVIQRHKTRFIGTGDKTGQGRDNSEKNVK